MTVPLGSVPPKSAALAGFPPEPVTAQSAEEKPEMSPSRMTIKVKAVVPVLPSALLAEVAEIERKLVWEHTDT